MKKQIASLAILCIASLSAIISCKKETTSQAIPETSLEITVSDELGNKVSGATVALFGSQTDWEHATNRVSADKITDANGIATFTNLISKKYYWGIIKDCKNNVNGSNTTSLPITANVLTKVSTSLTSTGTIKLINTSANPYKIYVNGAVIINSMSGGTTQNLTYTPIGNYSIRVVQLSGYAITPTDNTYTGNLICGGTLTTTFP